MSRREWTGALAIAVLVVQMGRAPSGGGTQPRFGGFFPGKTYVDRGISGQTTPQMLLRVRADVLDLRPNAAGYAIMSPLAETAIAKALR